ncbi:MAG: single-stranded DNA-binding protein [Candidatus Kapaibacterium sp.]|jgi:single-strand DNA-binding protein
MSYSVNKVILVGNLGQDPELRSTPQGKSVCTLKIATTDNYLDKTTNEWKDNTEWHTVVVWERQAEFASQRLKKGSKVYIEGALKHRSYEDKEGIRRYVTEILARDICYLERGENTGSYGSNTGRNSSSSNNQGNQPVKSYDEPNYNESPDSSFDDEVPF